jgi:NTP pyrophosphatase (non-canonical NTP hydrolase)
MEHEAKIKAIAEHYGYEHQVGKMYEELSELAVALTHKDEENIIEELADVLNVAEQLAHLLGAKKKVMEVMEAKLDRTLSRMHQIA